VTTRRAYSPMNWDVNIFAKVVMLVWDVGPTSAGIGSETPGEMGDSNVGKRGAIE
jgi:hypothetical protein